jgi:integrase
MASDGFVMTPTGERVSMRGSLHTRSWKDAQTLLNAKIQPYLRGEPVAVDITVEDAIRKFLQTKKTDIPARQSIGHISESVTAFQERSGRKPDDEQEQVRKYRDVLAPFQSFCSQKGLVLLRQVTSDDLDDFRSTWKGRPIWKGGHVVGHQPKTQAGKQRYQQNLRIFFAHAVDREWIIKNPASKLTKITVPDSVIEPFTANDWNSIFNKVEPTFPKIHKMVKAFVLMLKESALRIGDVVKLRPQDITSNGEIEITTEKTDEYVWVNLPREVIEALSAFEPKSKEYYFWTGNGQLDTAKKDWSSTMLKLFQAAEIKGGIARRSHNFRKTLAVRVAEKGGLDAAMNLLGHKSIKTTQKAYSKFTEERKNQVRDALLRVRESEKLMSKLD